MSFRRIFSTFAVKVRQVSTFIFAILIFLHPLCKMAIILSFKINQDIIAKTLCIKKEIKNNTCKGNCQLKKQLAKADEKEQEQTPSNQKEKYEVLYWHSQKSQFRPISLESYLRKLKPYGRKDLYTHSFTASIDRPPKLQLS